MRRDYKGISINTSKNTHETVFELVGNGPEARIVDVPCGSGAFVQRLKDHGYQDVLAIDIEDDLEIDHGSFRQGDMTDRLPLDDESVDTLVCIDGIETICRTSTEQVSARRSTNYAPRARSSMASSTSIGSKISSPSSSVSCDREVSSSSRRQTSVPSVRAGSG